MNKCGIKKDRSELPNLARHRSHEYLYTRKCKTKLGFFPLPLPEGERLKNCLTFPPEFSALDPCAGDGAAFVRLLEGTEARRYGIEIDANGAERATLLGIDTIQANALDVRCPAESFSLLYLNPPYDFETGQTNNQRLELAFLEHTYRWLKPGGALVLVIPQPQLKSCARILRSLAISIRSGTRWKRGFRDLADGL